MRQFPYQVLNSQGTILLEMMLAVCLSLSMIVGVTSIYAWVHHALNRQRELSVQSETAEKIIHLFRDEVVRAGSIGCAKLYDGFNVRPYHSNRLTHENYLLVDENSLTVSYQDFPGSILQMESNNHQTLKVDHGAHFSRDELAVISDCRHAEIFIILSTGNQGDMQVIKVADPLIESYQDEAVIGKMIVHQYKLQVEADHSKLISIDVNGRRDVIADNIEGLFFHQDEVGVWFGFDIRQQGVSTKWFGYAEKM